MDKNFNEPTDEEVKKFEEEDERINTRRELEREAMWPREELDHENYIGTEYTELPRSVFSEAAKAGYKAFITYSTQGAGAMEPLPKMLDYKGEENPPAVMYACEAAAWASYERIPSMSLAFWVAARFYALLCIQFNDGIFPILPREGTDYWGLIPHDSFIYAASIVSLYMPPNGVYEFDEDQLRFVAMIFEDGCML